MKFNWLFFMFYFCSVVFSPQVLSSVQTEQEQEIPVYVGHADNVDEMHDEDDSDFNFDEDADEWEVQALTPTDGLSPKLLRSVLENLGDVASGPYNADISYMFADIKYDGKGKLKILELGQGKNAGGKGHELLYGRGKIWKTFWHYLDGFKKPIWFVGPNVYSSTYARTRFAWHSLKRLNGHYQQSLKNLECNEFFMRCKQLQTRGQGLSIDDYKGIVVFRLRDDQRRSRLIQLKDFREQNPDFLTLDLVSRPYAASKALMSVLFDEPFLKKFRPISEIYPKKYSANLATEIVNKFKCNRYVIKPLNSGKGNGIIVVTRHALDSVLKKIILKKRSGNTKGGAKFNYAPSAAKAIAYWYRDKNPSFMIEEFVESKNVYVDGKPYDPTLRVLFAMAYDHGKISFKLLNSYWKLPLKSINEKGTLTECHKSKIDKREHCSLKVDQSDIRKVARILSVVMPKAYLKMIKVRHVMDQLR